MKELNINEAVHVRLTDRGRAVLTRYYEDLEARIKTKVPLTRGDDFATDADGWSRWQLWRLMQVFGSHTQMGCDPCFETTIRIGDSSLKPVEPPPSTWWPL